MERQVDSLLQRQRELFRTFRQSIHQYRNAESKASSWRQQKLKEAGDKLKNASDKLEKTQQNAKKEFDNKLKVTADKLEKIQKDAKTELSRARNALNKVRELSSKVVTITPSLFEQPETTHYPASNETVTELANKLSGRSSTAVRYADETREAVEHLQNCQSAKWESDRLNLSLLLLFTASCGLIPFIIGIVQQSAILLILGLFPPPILLACADTVWNLGQKKPGNGFTRGYYKEPGEGFSKGFLWLYLVAPIAPLVALGWIFASYPASLAAIDERYRPRASRTAVIDNIHDLIPNLMQVLSEAELYHDILLKRTQLEIEQIQQEHDSNIRQIETDYQLESKQIRQEHDSSVRQIETEYQQMVSETVSNYEKSWQQVQKQSTTLQQTLGLIGAPWDDPLWDSWPPTAEKFFPPYLRIGHLVDQDERNRLAVPALVPVIGKGNMIIKCSGAAKDKAVQILQNLMLRMLVTVPPGKLRFTLIDPVGLGQSMASFMGLADYDEALVGGKIWTEPQHIEEQLARLTEHMEFVIQKFLRDKYPTIEDYNTEAGEVAETYRGLVIVNFPVNFTESATRRLVSIALNGPRCGVYTLMTMDSEQQLPYGFHKRDDMDTGAATPSEAIRHGNHIGSRNYVMEAYCVKCRTKREMKDPKSITMKNGEQAIQGTCPVCRTKMFRIEDIGKHETSTRKRHKMYSAICAACGKECEVPFQPREGRPVYCSECYVEIRKGDSGYDEDDDNEE